MADLSQVESALVGVLAAIIYPNGTGQPSITGGGVKIYRGWPEQDTLNRDLREGECHVTVFPRGGVSSVEPDAFSEWSEDTRPAPSLTATVDATGVVTFAGTATVPKMIAAVAADNVAWTHVVAPTDTPASVATALAALISLDRPAEAAGATLTIADASRVGAAVYVGGRERRRARTQRQGLQVSLWCPTPAMRDVLGTAIDTALADMPRLALPDGSVAQVAYNGTMTDDGPRANPMYRRDLLLTLGYSTFAERELPPIAAVELNVEAGGLLIARRVKVNVDATP